MGVCLVLATACSAWGEERLWSGAGTDGLWSNTANWQNGVPQSGDAVRFPAGSAQLSNTNDLSGLVLTELRIEANSLRLSGVELALQTGISYTSQMLGLVVELVLPLRLAGPAVEINAAPGCTIRVTGQLSAPPTTLLALDGGGDFRFNGPVMGAYQGATWFKRGFFGGAGFSGPLFRNSITVGGTTNFASFVLQTGNQFANFPTMTVLTNGHLINVATLNHVGSLRLDGGQITLNGASPNGSITVNGDALLGPGSSLRVTAFSSGVPGALSVTGRVSIAECSFGILPTGGPITSTSVIIQNDGTDPIQGQFQALPEGGLLMDSQKVFQVSYRGGDGNDFTISPVGSLALRSIRPLAGNQIRLEGLSATNRTILVESAPSLSAPSWQLLGTTTPDTNGVFVFLDARAFSDPAGYYRAR
ncbi:MAG: hypothetical protein JNN07_02555 [Verrucomicrobiales bacterium]|nr:hypothetical protein [Verrucomicrobiales bacterium]